MEYLNHNDLLHIAIRRGDVEGVNRIITSMGLYYKDSWHEGYTPLRYALIINQLKCAEEILKAGANINYFDRYSGPVLHLAVNMGSLEFLQLLLDRKPDINVMSSRGETALHIAVRNKSEHLVDLLILHGANVNAVSSANMAPLQLAIHVDSLDIVKILLKAGADSNLETSLGKPFHIAVHKGRKEIVKYFLKMGVDVNVRSENGSTALHSICNFHVQSDTYHQGTIDCFALLSENGANINAVNDDGKTPLFHAVKMNRYEIVELLLECNPDVNIEANKLAFVKALESFDSAKHPAILKKFLKCGFTCDAEKLANDFIENNSCYYESDNCHCRIMKNLLTLGLLNTETVVPFSHRGFHKQD